MWRAGVNIELTPSLETDDDGISAINPKSIPGATIDITVLARNDGASATDNNSVEVVVPIPTQAELFVGDLDGLGNPVIFTDGTAPNQSGLTWLSPSTQIEYSNNGGISYTYTPPLAADFDDNVTHLKILPAGTFSGVGPSSIPEFTVAYRVRVK